MFTFLRSIGIATLIIIGANFSALGELNFVEKKPVFLSSFISGYYPTYRHLNANSGNNFFHIDINGDAVTDFCFIAGTGGYESFVLECSFSGSPSHLPYSSYQISELGPGGWADSFLMGDVNGDRMADLCQLNYNYTHLTCFFGNGDGSFVYPASFTTDYIDGGWAKARWLVDVNGDSNDDFCRLIGSDRYRLACILLGGNNKISILGEVTSEPFWEYPAANPPGIWSDSSGNGKLDFHFDSGGVFYRLSNELSSNKGQFELEKLYIPFRRNKGGNPIAIGNAHDNKTTALCQISASNIICAEITKSMKQKKEVSIANSKIGDIGWGATRTWFDVDSDGNLDFCTLVENWTKISCYLNTGSGSFIEQQLSSYIDGGYGYFNASTNASSMADTKHWVYEGLFGSFVRLTSRGNHYELSKTVSFLSEDQCTNAHAQHVDMLRGVNRQTPPQVVFRKDTRDPDEIFKEGFLPRGTNRGLAEHIFGMSLYWPGVARSHWVSTTASEAWLRQATTGSTQPFWVYDITPTAAFTSVGYSFRMSIENAQSSEERVGLERAFNQYQAQEEYAAGGGIRPNNIIRARRFVYDRDQGGFIQDGDPIPNSLYVRSEPAVSPNYVQMTVGQYQQSLGVPITSNMILDQTPDPNRQRNSLLSLSLSCFGVARGSVDRGLKLPTMNNDGLFDFNEACYGPKPSVRVARNFGRDICLK